jgi:hypothetical protein
MGIDTWSRPTQRGQLVGASSLAACARSERPQRGNSSKAPTPLPRRRCGHGATAWRQAPIPRRGTAEQPRWPAGLQCLVAQLAVIRAIVSAVTSSTSTLLLDLAGQQATIGALRVDLDPEVAMQAAETTDALKLRCVGDPELQRPTTLGRILNVLASGFFERTVPSKCLTTALAWPDWP